MSYVNDAEEASRIDMRIMRTQNNFWNTGHTTMSTFGLRSHSSMAPRVKFAPFTRLNQHRMNVKFMKGFMNDSTAVNMGDPNSMRDQGQTRNAVYNANILLDEGRATTYKRPYNAFLRRDGPTNNTFYSFGGSKKIRDETDRDDHLLNPVFRDYEEKVRPPIAELVAYPKMKNQRVQDYTKNISQSIFSPGEMKAYAFCKDQATAEQARDHQRASRRKCLKLVHNSQKPARYLRRNNSAQPAVRTKLS